MVKMNNISCLSNYAIPPGETLRETLQAIGMTQVELAERTGRPKKTINEIISGKAAITAETALQFERVLGIPASFWNNLERNYEETLARLREEEEFDRDKEWIEKFPIGVLTRMGWIPRQDSPVIVLKSILNFFGVAGIDEWKTLWQKPEGAYRKSKAYQSNPHAVAAWLRKGEVEAARIETKPYKPRFFKEALKNIRSLTREPPEVFEPKMRRLCAEAGVAIVFVPEIPGTHVYGVTRWLKTTKALVQLSLRGKTDDHLWFTFFHEAGHIVRHGKGEMFIEANNESYHEVSRKEKEEEANEFAQNFLILKNEYRAFVHKRDFSTATIRSFARKLGVAPGIVVGRLQHDQILQFNQGNSLKKRLQFAE